MESLSEQVYRLEEQNRDLVAKLEQVTAKRDLYYEDLKISGQNNKDLRKINKNLVAERDRLQASFDYSNDYRATISELKSKLDTSERNHKALRNDFEIVVAQRDKAYEDLQQAKMRVLGFNVHAWEERVKELEEVVRFKNGEIKRYTDYINTEGGKVYKAIQILRGEG